MTFHQPQPSRKAMRHFGSMNRPLLAYQRQHSQAPRQMIRHASGQAQAFPAHHAGGLPPRTTQLPEHFAAHFATWSRAFTCELIFEPGHHPVANGLIWPQSCSQRGEPLRCRYHIHAIAQFGIAKVAHQLHGLGIRPHGHKSGKGPVRHVVGPLAFDQVRQHLTA